MVYECQMTVTLTFNVKADCEEDAMDYISTHTHEDVMKETSMYDINYDDQVLSENSTGNYGIDLT